MLPGLLVDAQVASQEMTGDQQAVAFGLLAHSYNTASSVLRKLGDNGLAVIAADRARLGTDHADLHTIFGPISLAIEGIQVAAELSPQLTAFFTSAPILASSAAVNSVSAKEVGHMAPSSRFAVALKPNVAYLSLNFDAGVK
jgi:hypothetical protein